MEPWGSHRCVDASNADARADTDAIQPSAAATSQVAVVPAGYTPKIGDAFIRCSDNIQYFYYSTSVQTYFPWLVGNTPRDPTIPIEFPYPYSVLHLLAKFTSNQSLELNRDTCTWGYITDCFQAASRYRLYSLLAWLRSQFALPSSAFYLGQNPIGAYGICGLYQFQAEKQQAFQSCIGKLDLRDKSAVDTIVKECPDTKIALELFGRLTRRSAVITQLFSDLHVYPMDTRSKYWTLGPLGRDAPQYDDFTCATCQDMSIFATPVWLAFWAYGAKNELLKSPGDQCDHVFRVEYLGRRVTHSQVFGGGKDDHELEAPRLDENVVSCGECLSLILKNSPSAWEKWASKVQGYLRFELGDDF